MTEIKGTTLRYEDHPLGRVQRCAQGPRVADDLAGQRHAARV